MAIYGEEPSSTAKDGSRTAAAALRIERLNRSPIKSLVSSKVGRDGHFLWAQGKIGDRRLACSMR